WTDLGQPDFWPTMRISVQRILRHSIFAVLSIALGISLALGGYLLMKHYGLISPTETSSAAKSDVAASAEKAASAAERNTQEQSALGRVLSVNTVPSTQQYDIGEWNGIRQFAGWIDQMAVDGIRQPHNGPLQVRPDSIIKLSGWAGHPEFGMRVDNVLISVCKRIVGVAEVTKLRPDVAKKVHMNLLVSGWSATVAVSQMPDCAQRVFSVWALAPIGFNIFPLQGGRFLKPRPDAGTQTESKPSPVSISSAGVLPRRVDRENPKVVRFDIRTQRLRIRSCPNTKCKVVGKFSKGKHNGFIIDEAENWILVQSGKQVGWIYLPFVDIRG
ncbi:MAG TPA: hypothetical protein DCS82_00845, partial [Rhodospirillaceae bacterium]|nr:hypothetical protein [Rhodospirillaceae bacterium]